MFLLVLHYLPRGCSNVADLIILLSQHYRKVLYPLHSNFASTCRLLIGRDR